MKLTIDPQDLADAVAWSVQNYDAKDTQSYVALTVERDSGTASLTHVNQVSHMRAPLPISDLEFEEGEDEDSYSIPLDGPYLKNLAGVVKRMGLKELVLSKKLTKKNDPLKVKSDRQSFTVPVLMVETRKSPALTNLGEANDFEFFGALQRLAKLCTLASADAGAATGAVAVKFGDKKLTLMGTDSYSLGEVILDYEPNGKELKEFSEKAANGATVLVPRAAALTVKPSRGATDTVELVYDAKGKKFGYRFDDGRIALFSLDQSTPTIYETLKTNVIDASDASVDLPLVDLTRAIDAIASLSPEDLDVDVKIDGTKKRKKFVVSDSKKSNVIELEVEGMDFDGEVDLSFFRDVISKSLVPVTGGTIRIFFASDGPQMVVIRKLKEEDGKIDKSIFSLAIIATS